MRPALVWGCTRYPSRSNATISDRTVAEETCTPGALATCEEPTGSAVPMYSVTTASRMAARRALRARSSATASAGVARSSFGVIGVPGTQVYRVPGRVPRAPRPSVVAQAEGGDERFLGNFDPADVLHALLALLLLLQQLALAGDVPAVALGQHVLALGLDRLAGHDAPADGRLNGHVEQLPRNELAQLLGHTTPVAVGRRAVHNGRERVTGRVVDEDVDPHQVGG